jgi:hypothetical protein
MTDAARQQLEAFKAAGGQLIHIDDLDHIDAALADIVPTAKCEPACSGLRVSLRRWPGGGAMFVFNEGNDDYRGLITFDLDGKLHEVEPATGAIRAVEIADSSDIDSSGNRQPVPLNLMVGESRLLIASANVHANLAATVSFENSGQEQSIELADGWTASVERQYVVGEHDFEIHPFANAEFQPATLGRWATSLRLGEDFSGHVTYRRTVSVPDSWHGKRLFLTLGGLEYAARVSVDGRPVGCVLWSPWRIELPPPMDHDEFVLDIEVSNTLANELTSQRVRDAWTKRIGPGWPGLYHARALEFEQKARGGGLLGPVSLNCSPTAANPFAEGPRRRAGQRSPKSRGMF